MPSTEMILWAGISGLIVVMLGIIGYLVKTGFDGLRAELTKIWDKLESNSSEHATLRAKVEAIEARCDERGNHCSAGHHHKREDDTN